MMRNTVLLLFSVVFLLLGCTPPAAPLLVYTKYENEDAVPRIKVEEAKREADAGNVIFVDSRPEAAFKAEHLPGAVSIPLGADAAAKFSELPKGKKIIVYCT